MANETAHPGTLSGGPGRGNDPLERAMFALSNQRPGDAEKIAGEMLSANPGHVQARRVLGYALMMQDRAAEAVAALEPAVRGRHDPEIETQLAIALRQAGRDEDALSRLKRATKRRPPYAPAFNELGATLFAMKHYDEAVDALKRGLEVAPAMPELSVQLGHVYLQLRDSASAKAAFGKALGIAPGSPGALWGMGKAHQQVGENKMAIDYFRRCLAHMPDDVGTWLNLGHSLLEIGETDAGYECFRTAARGDPKRYGGALTTLVKSGRGRFWLRPSAAARFLRSSKS